PAPRSSRKSPATICWFCWRAITQPMAGNAMPAISPWSTAQPSVASARLPTTVGASCVRCWRTGEVPSEALPGVVASTAVSEFAPDIEAAVAIQQNGERGAPLGSTRGGADVVLGVANVHDVLAWGQSEAGGAVGADRSVEHARLRELLFAGEDQQPAARCRVEVEVGYGEGIARRRGSVGDHDRAERQRGGHADHTDNAGAAQAS